jgi:hypothetical protein
MRGLYQELHPRVPPGSMTCAGRHTPEWMICLLALRHSSCSQSIGIGDPAQGGFSSPVTLRRRRQARWLDVSHQDLTFHGLDEQLIGSL